MADWYVYQHDGDPLGPWSTDAVAEAILAGKLAPDCSVAAPGGPRWLRALDVPVIGARVEGVPTRARRDSGLRLIPGAFTSEDDRPVFGSTMMIVKDDELHVENAPPTTRRGPSPFTRPEDTAEMAAAPAMSFRYEPREEEDERITRIGLATSAELDEDQRSTDLQLPPSS